MKYVIYIFTMLLIFISCVELRLTKTAKVNFKNLAVYCNFGNNDTTFLASVVNAVVNSMITTFNKEVHNFTLSLSEKKRQHK